MSHKAIKRIDPVRSIMTCSECGQRSESHAFAAPASKSCVCSECAYRATLEQQTCDICQQPVDTARIDYNTGTIACDRCYNK